MTEVFTCLSVWICSLWHCGRNHPYDDQDTFLYNFGKETLTKVNHWWTIATKVIWFYLELNRCYNDLTTITVIIDTFYVLNLCYASGHQSAEIPWLLHFYYNKTTINIPKEGYYKIWQRKHYCESTIRMFTKVIHHHCHHKEKLI